MKRMQDLPAKAPGYSSVTTFFSNQASMCVAQRALQQARTTHQDTLTLLGAPFDSNTPARWLSMPRQEWPLFDVCSAPAQWQQKLNRVQCAEQA